MTDGALQTEAFDVEGDATLTFWHWMDAEVSSTQPGYAYDGGFLEMSIDEGPWTQITPDGGYPYVVREGSGPGPFPAGTPFYSGTFDWTEARVELEGVSGSVRVRFRFGSDGSVTQEGWYIDDVRIISDNPGLSSAEEEVRIPTRLALHANRPNPFPGATSIRFDLPQPTPVRLQIFDTSGRLVRTLVDQALPPGNHRVVWDGRDGGQQPVASGVYYSVLQTGGTERSRQMLLMR